MNFGILFSSSLQKSAGPVRNALLYPMMGVGLAGPGIEYASMGLVKSPWNLFSDDESVSDRDVVDQVVYRDGEYFSPKGTDYGKGVVKEHLKYQLPVSLMSSRMQEVKDNRTLDRTGVLSEQMKTTGEGGRLHAGGYAGDEKMMARLSPQERKDLEEERFSKLKRMTSSITPHMVAGAQRRMAAMQQGAQQ